MHILFLTPEYHTKELRACGGLGVYIRKIAVALTKQGHRVSVLLLGKQNFHWKDEEIDIYEVRSLNYKFIEFPPKISFFRNILVFFIDRLRVRNIIKKKLVNKDIQVIQAASYQSLAALCPRQWPIVTRLSSLESLWIKAQGTRVTLFQRCIIWAELHQIKKSKAVFGPSSFIAQKAIEFSHRMVSIIPTLSEKIFSNISYKFYNKNLLNKKYLLYFGQLSRIKGTDILIQSLAHVLQKFPDIYMIFIGRDDGLPSGISCRQYASITLKNYLNRVIFFPPLSHEELIPCIQNACCIIQPSRIDNLPNTCIEALSLSKPVIATYPTSIEELIRDGINGLLVPKENVQELSKCICAFLNGDRKISTPGLLEHSRNDYLDKLEELYAQVIGKN